MTSASTFSPSLSCLTSRRASMRHCYLDLQFFRTRDLEAKCSPDCRVEAAFLSRRMKPVSLCSRDLEAVFFFFPRRKLSFFPGVKLTTLVKGCRGCEGQNQRREPLACSRPSTFLTSDSEVWPGRESYDTLKAEVANLSEPKSCIMGPKSNQGQPVGSTPLK